MTTALATDTTLERESAIVATMSTEELRRDFAQGLRIVRDRLVRMAAILFELERRGELVEGDKFLLRMLRKIAKGDLLVDVVVRFAGKPYTLASIGAMPPDRQAELLDKSDTEVDKICRRRSRAGSDKNLPGLRLADMAAGASVGDVADMCLTLINGCQQPHAVAEKLLPVLQRIKSNPKKKATLHDWDE